MRKRLLRVFKERAFTVLPGRGFVRKTKKAVRISHPAVLDRT